MFCVYGYTCNISCQMKTNAEIEASKWNIPPLKKTTSDRNLRKFKFKFFYILASSFTKLLWNEKDNRDGRILVDRQTF